MSVPGESIQREQQLVRYLLGLLPEEEAERLDEQSVVADEFAARLQCVENDLVDAYVSGTLEGDIRERARRLGLRIAPFTAVVIIALLLVAQLRQGHSWTWVPLAVGVVAVLMAVTRLRAGREFQGGSTTRPRAWSQFPRARRPRRVARRPRPGARVSTRAHGA